MSSRTVVRKVSRSQPKPSVAREFELDTSDVQAVINRIAGPKWLADRRLNAWETYQKMPMPTLSDEPWRRTDIRGLPSDQVRLGAVADVPVPQELLRPLAGEENAAQITLRPGCPASIELAPHLAEKGVIFCDWRTAEREHSELLEKHLGSVVADDEGKFSALAAAMVEDGVLVYVPAGVELQEPLHSILWAPGAGRLFFSRILVIVEDRASLTYVHEFASPHDQEGPTVHDGIVELIAGEAANLRFVELQNWGEGTWNFTHERARIGRDSSLDWIFGAVGSKLTKNFTELDLAGQGANGRMSGFYFADGSQHLDHDTQQNHLAENTTSDLLFKGALLGKARSVWQGMIYVAPGAQKTDGYQANRNLILESSARADSIPGLEIMADDVRCTHGATVGQLEEEPIFYLMSRGLTREEAERIVVDGFFAPIMERIPFEELRHRFEAMIDDKMNPNGAARSVGYSRSRE